MKDLNWINLGLALLNAAIGMESFLKEDYGWACVSFAIVGSSITFFVVGLKK
jgi:hypothetical protein